MARIELTRRAILDIADIEQYSLKEWGPRVADEYLVDLSAALERLGESPQLLRERPEIFPRLRFYRVRKHFLVGDVIGDKLPTLGLGEPIGEAVKALEAAPAVMVLDAGHPVAVVTRSDVLRTVGAANDDATDERGARP